MEGRDPRMCTSTPLHSGCPTVQNLSLEENNGEGDPLRAEHREEKVPIPTKKRNGEKRKKKKKQDRKTSEGLEPSGPTLSPFQVEQVENPDPKKKKFFYLEEQEGRMGKDARISRRRDIQGIKTNRRRAMLAKGWRHVGWSKESKKNLTWKATEEKKKNSEEKTGRER